MSDRVRVRPKDDVQGMLQDMVLMSADLEEFLDGLVEAASTVMSDDHGGILTSVTVLRPRAKATIASSCTAARRLTELQFRFDDGPCVEAAASGRTVAVEDFALAIGHPLYGSAALRKGIRSGLGIPVQLDGPERAAVSYYAREPGTFSSERVELARHFAGRASTPLRLALRVARLKDKAEHLAAAMESRTTIDLAAGVIMAQNRCSQDEAIEILRTASSARNMKLRDLALNVLTTTVDAPVTTHFD